MKISFYNKNNIIVTGSVANHTDNFTKLGGIWNAKAKGWLFSTNNIDGVLSYINNLTDDDSDTEYNIDKSEESDHLISKSDDADFLVPETDIFRTTRRNDKYIFEHNGVTAEKYSERSFVLRGDTKKYKNEIKNLGGRWNPSLRDGCGWVFSLKKLDDVLAFFKT